MSIYGYRLAQKLQAAITKEWFKEFLSGCEKFAASFIDDIVIHDTDFESHVKHVQDVLGRLRKAGLTAKPSKCQVGHAQVPFLGHLVGFGEQRPLEAKVETIRNWPIPDTPKKVKSFLGLAGYYRKFVKDYFTIAVR